MKDYLREILPLVWMVVAIALSAKVGDTIVKKTGKKLIGWPLAVVIFLALIALGGAISNI